MQVCRQGRFIRRLQSELISPETHVGGITSSSSPCEAAAKASMDCLEKNDYKRSQCLHIFEAYKECKKTWVLPSFCGP